MRMRPFSIIVSAAIGLFAGLASAVAPGYATPLRMAESSSAVSPFCVMLSGPRGQGSLPEVCRYFAYEQCLQAAATMRGTCVANIDYRGTVTPDTGASASGMPHR